MFKKIRKLLGIHTSSDLQVRVNAAFEECLAELKNKHGISNFKGASGDHFLSVLSVNQGIRWVKTVISTHLSYLVPQVKIGDDYRSLVRTELIKANWRNSFFVATPTPTRVGEEMVTLYEKDLLGSIEVAKPDEPLKGFVQEREPLMLEARLRGDECTIDIRHHNFTNEWAWVQYRRAENLALVKDAFKERSVCCTPAKNSRVLISEEVNKVVKEIYDEYRRVYKKSEEFYDEYVWGQVTILLPNGCTEIHPYDSSGLKLKEGFLYFKDPYTSVEYAINMADKSYANRDFSE